MGHMHFTHVKEVQNMYPTCVLETLQRIFIECRITPNSRFKYNISQHIQESLGPDKDMKKNTILGEPFSL